MNSVKEVEELAELVHDELFELEPEQKEPDPNISLAWVSLVCDLVLLTAFLRKIGMHVRSY